MTRLVPSPALRCPYLTTDTTHSFISLSPPPLPSGQACMKVLRFVNPLDAASLEDGMLSVSMY